MFFPMLRRQAKWVFVLLAIVFAAGFVFFGVGSGSTGISNLLDNWLNIGKASPGPSISSLQARTRAHPNDPQAFRNLATAAEGKGKNAVAVQALERLTALRPKDTNALQELAGLYQKQIQDVSSQFVALPIAQVAQTFASSSFYAPPSTTKLGQAYADGAVLGDPINQAISSLASQTQSEYQLKLTNLESKELAAYQNLVRADPSDPTLQVQLAQAAQTLGDTKTAIAAYKRFLKLAPTDPLASAVKQQLKQLQPTPAKKKTTKKTSKKK
jgi:regulator of sirC expression with transglutaminase-like and TPR domain